MKNKAIKFLNESCQTIEDYFGMCSALVDDLIHEYGEDRVKILYIKPVRSTVLRLDHYAWRYHMVAVIDGLVHDPWSPDHVKEPESYIRLTFNSQDVSWSING